MTKRELRQWRAAVNRCLKQEAYGNHHDCELCKHCNCNDCICVLYGDYIGCTSLYYGTYGTDPDMDGWPVDKVRPILTDILAWIEAQLKEERS